MELYVFDSRLKKMKMVLTNQNIVEAHEITQINTAGQLTFTATIKSDVDEKIETTDIVFVKVKDDRYHPYKIVQSNMPTPNTIQYTCIEYAYYVLNKNGVVKDQRCQKTPMNEVIKKIMGGTNWLVGYVDTSLPTFTGNFYWQNRTDCFSKVIEATGAELEFYFTISNNKINGRYVDAYKKIGTDTHQRFTYGMNALEIVAENSITDMVTRVYPLGSGEMYDSEGNGARKLKIDSVEWSKAKGDPTDKPLGKDYLVYGDAKYNLDTDIPPTTVIEFQDEKDPEKLCKRAFNWLKQNNRPKVQFKAKVSDVGDLKLGDRVVIDREDLDIKYVTRVFKLDRNLLNEKLNTIELGDVVAHTLADAISNVSSSLADTNKRVDSVASTITDSNGNTVTYGSNEPTTKKKGDTWYKPGDIVDGVQQYDVYVWDGEKWVLTIGNQLQNELLSKVEQAQKDTEEAKQQAQEASNKADFFENKFENDLNNVRIDVDKVKQDASIALNQAESAHQEALNNTQTIQTFKDETAQKFVEIKASSNALATQVSNLDRREQSSTVQLSNQISTIITNGVNLFPNGQFNDTQLDTYFRGHLSSSKVVNGQLQVVSKNTNTYIRTKDSLMVNEGDVLVCDFDYIKDFDGGNLAFGIVENTTNKWKWLTNSNSGSADSNLRHAKIELVIPAEFSKVDLYVGIFNTSDSLAGKVFYLDNIYVKQKYVNQTEFNQTIDGFEQKIEGVDKKVVDITSTVNGISTTIKDPTTGLSALNTKVQTAEGELTQIKNLEGESTIVQTAKGLKTQVNTLSQNNSMFPNSIFIDDVLSNYFYGVPDTNRFSVVDKKESDGQDYGRKNVLKMVATSSRDVSLRTNNFVGCESGTTLSVSFDYFNKTGNSNVAFNARFRFNDGTADKWSKLTANGSGDNWIHFFGEIKVPDNAASVQLMIGNDKSTLEGSVTYIDNVLVSASSVTKSELTQTADVIKAEVSSLDEKTKASLAVLQDDVNLKVDKDKVINQINVSTEGILIDGKKTHITGQTTIDNAVITSSMIKDVSANKVTTGTLNAKNVKIINLDVNSLGGNYATFLKTAWKDNNSYSELTPNGLKFFKENNGLFQKDAYLSVYSSQLTWRTSAKAWHYINQETESILRNSLTIAGVTNGDSIPASINLRSSGYDCCTLVGQSAHYGGKYIYFGSLGSSTDTDGMKQAWQDIYRAKNKTDNPGTETYRISMKATNDIFMCLTERSKGSGIRFGELTSMGSSYETQIVYNNDNNSGMFIKSQPTYGRTYSYSANMFVTSGGYVGRSTSARKYKQDIEYIDNIDEAKKTLDIQPAEWADKKQMMSHARTRAGVSKPEDEERLSRRYIGFIADDFADAGFEKLIIRDKTGAVEEFQYNRLSVYHHQMIKDLYNQIDTLKNEIKELKGDN